MNENLSSDIRQMTGDQLEETAVARPMTRNDFKPIQPKNRRLGKRTWLVAAFFAVVAGLCGLGRLPWTILGGYALLSVTTFGTYTWDKAAAQAGRWRTPEKTLHLLDLLGGWPGGLMAQEWVRHKSAKTRFQVIFWATVVANCALLAWAGTRTPAEIDRLISLLRNSLGA